MNTLNSNSISESVETTPHLGRKVASLEKAVAFLTSQLGGVVTACHLRGYNVGESLGEWLEKQFKDAETNLTELLRTKAETQASADDEITADIKRLIEVNRTLEDRVSNLNTALTSAQVDLLRARERHHKLKTKLANALQEDARS